MVAQNLISIAASPESRPNLKNSPHSHAARPSDAEKDHSIPVIDLSPLFEAPTSQEKRKRIVEQIAAAAEKWGFFQVLNHGVPLELMEAAFAASKEFFALPLEEKVKARSQHGSSPVTAGYVHDDYAKDKLNPRERLLFFSEGSTTSESSRSFSQYNVWPEKPKHMKSVIDEFMTKAGKTAIFILGLVSESLGLPCNVIHEQFIDESSVLAAYCYASSPESALGNPDHKDATVLTLVAQDEVSGLEVLGDDEWVTVPPIKGALVVNMGDILQVWSNGKFKSMIHRVVNDKERARYSIAYFCIPGMETKVAPLEQYTNEMGEPARYRRFEYKEYLMHRFNNLSKDAKYVGIDYYAV